MSLRVAVGFDPSLLFEDPVEVWTPTSLEGALGALDRAQTALDNGFWIAGALTYEFGAMLNGIRAAREDAPLLVLGAFRGPERRSWRADTNHFELTAPLARIPYDDYTERLHYVLRRIADGEVYQVNYTVPFDIGFSGDPFDLFRFLGPRSNSAYSAFVQCDDLAIVSISPELFLQFDESRVTTKPMKGTATLERIDELHNEKNRAEHLMIVDLLRNDLHRVCTDVRVDRLFEIERYPTFATMTSTISGALSRNIPFAQVLRATFPCGSVTGAPKRAAMQHIAQIEPNPRGFYTGCVGFLSPSRRGWWNVPIRTLQFNSRESRFDAGGGIVSDSNAGDEWAEIRIKSRFLDPAIQNFTLLETLRGGPSPSNVKAHVNRLLASASAFGLRADRALIRSELTSAVTGTRPILVRLRLSGAGIAVSNEPLEESSQPVALCYSRLRVRSTDPLLHHKTSWRRTFHEALRDARERGCFDAILRNERGEITEGARTNIFVRIGNTLYTPPLSCGVLPGILRSQLVSEGKAVEKVLFEDDLKSAQAIFAGNSARGLLRAAIRE